MEWKTGFFLCLLGHMCITGILSECTLGSCPNNTKAYLTQFGYLNPTRKCEEDDLRAALIKFQEMNYGLNNITVTAECDQATVEVFKMPRCGCEDIVKFEKKMMPQNLLGPQEYRLGNTKWSDRVLTWKVVQYPSRNRQLSNNQVDDAMRRGLQIWGDVTSLNFKQVDTERSDITIGFWTYRHANDNSPFDGPGRVLAHAFFPQSGVVHFDDSETFVLGSNRGTELYIVAAHEFGHTLGISHSNIKEALMAPYYRYVNPLKLHPDDIAAAQALYGPPVNSPRTQPTRPPMPPPTTPRANAPDYCKMDIKASFKISRVSYVFTEEKVDGRLKTFVYQVHSDGIRPDTRRPIEKLFRNSGPGRWPRSNPRNVDAATYEPSRQKVYLFRYTRAYRYTYNRGEFILDRGYPRWMNVKEFPERPRAAIAMPYSDGRHYYMLIFGTTMVWDWNFYTQRVGAWAYPIDAYGRNMPQRVDGALLQDSNYVAFFKHDKYYLFSIRHRRVLDMTSTYVKSIHRDFFKKDCA